MYDCRLEVVDRLLALHFGIPEDSFKYNWKCIFPESAAQAQERKETTANYLAVLTQAGIVSRESALEEAIKAGIVSEGATVGDNPQEAALISAKQKPATGNNNGATK